MIFFIFPYNQFLIFDFQLQVKVHLTISLTFDSIASSNGFCYQIPLLVRGSQLRLLPKVLMGP